MAFALAHYKSPFEDGPWSISSATVEAQDIYRGKTHNPKNILHLGHVAGLAVMFLYHHISSSCDIFMPEPDEWKGTAPKQIHQARVLTSIGWPFIKIGGKATGYCAPSSTPGFDLDLNFEATKCKISKGDWKHLNDAIGLARWGMQRSDAYAVRVADLAKAAAAAESIESPGIVLEAPAKRKRKA